MPAKKETNKALSQSHVIFTPHNSTNFSPRPSLFFVKYFELFIKCKNREVVSEISFMIRLRGFVAKKNPIRDIYFIDNKEFS